MAAPRLIARLAGLAVLLPAMAFAAQVDNWQKIVRNAPYWDSQGVYSNMVTIRQWVLLERGYCSEPERHLLFDQRGRFLGYIDDGDSREQTQQRLNTHRAELNERGEVSHWVAGGPDTTGYPFALACDQPHANLADARARYLGSDDGDRLWGLWDDLDFASRDQPLPLHDALRYVYRTRLQQDRLTLPEELPRYLAGMLLIESGANPRAHSAANARGILQLTPSVLADCGVAASNHWHRLAQLDCALKLMTQNGRNLEAPFQARFGHLPRAKRDRLFTLLLIQAYHGGAGRVTALLEDDPLSAPANYFADNHERFSAGDILFGMVFHNLGRNRLGLSSLYYVADVEVAMQDLCASLPDDSAGFCP